MERAILNLHTKKSILDGVVDIKDYIQKAKEEGITTMGITDIESVRCFGEVYKLNEASKVYNIKFLYGTQLKIHSNFDTMLLNPDVHIYVRSKIGLKNLYILLSYVKENNLLDFDSDIFINHRKDLLIGSGGNNGEIYLGYLFDKDEKEIEEIAVKYDFLEIQPNYNHEINNKIVKLGEKLNKLVIGTEDVYYLDDYDFIGRKILKYNYNNYHDISKEVTNVEKVGQFKNTKEMLEEFNYLGKNKAYELVVLNSNKLADMCEEFDIFPRKKSYLKFDEAKEMINKVCENKLKELYGENIDKEIMDRCEYELKTIYNNNFENIYYLAYLIARKAKEDKERFLLRGSGSSSFIAYLLEISFIDPIKYNIPFETFSYIYGDYEPDFDFNFRPTYKEKIHKYILEMFGEKNVIYPGTTGTIANRTASLLTSKFFDENNLSYLSHTSVIKNIIGTCKTVGVYSGGLLIVDNNDDIFNYTPVEYINNHKVSHFDYHLFHNNLLKIDLVSYEPLEWLKILEDKTGVGIDEINLNDEKIYKLFKLDNNGNINTDGLIEFNTDFAKNIIKICNPNTIEDLMKISSLLHGTNVWTDNIEYLIDEHELSELPCSRDDIFLYLLENGIKRKNAFEIMTFVRKGKVNNLEFMKKDLKKYNLDKWNKYKKIMKEANIPNWYINSLEKIEYMFPKAHSCNNTILSLLLGWYKVYYPNEFKKII